jgi:integrase/recombinase XerD
MSPLRRRMIEDMAIRKLAPKTQQGYIRTVRDFAAFLGRSPDTASFEDVRRFQLHLAGSGAHIPVLNHTVAALRFFFRVTLKRSDVIEHTTFLHAPRKLPVVLSPEEVARLLEAAPGLKYRAALSVAYGAGLRAAEVISLKTGDIDSKRMVIRVEQGKGRKDRYVMLSPHLLELLRAWWRAARPQGWLFPGRDRVQSPRLRRDCLPKEVIRELAEHLLAHAEGQPLIDPYAVYQHLMDYWAETMQDDCYIIAADGWVAKAARILETDKKGKTKDKGCSCDLVPKPLIVARYFAKEHAAIVAQQAALEVATTGLAELEEEHGGEEGFLGALDKIAKVEVAARLKEIKGHKDAKEETTILQQWLKLNTEESDFKRAIREAEAALDQLAYDKYPKLTEAEIQTLVVDDKWLTSLHAGGFCLLALIPRTVNLRVAPLAALSSAISFKAESSSGQVPILCRSAYTIH